MIRRKKRKHWRVAHPFSPSQTRLGFEGAPSFRVLCERVGATAVTDNYVCVRRTILVRACDDANRQQVPVRVPLVGTRSSLRAGSRLRSG